MFLSSKIISCSIDLSIDRSIDLFIVYDICIWKSNSPFSKLLVIVQSLPRLLTINYTLDYADDDDDGDGDFDGDLDDQLPIPLGTCDVIFHINRIPASQTVSQQTGLQCTDK